MPAFCPRIRPLAHASLLALSLGACNGRLEVTDDNIGGRAGAGGNAGSGGSGGNAGTGLGGSGGSTAGASGSAGSSGESAACDDGVRNGDEAGVDCGGSHCPSCPFGNACSNGVQCTHGVCSDGVCQPPTCEDGLSNGDEDGVDCGGSSCGPCLTLCQRECAVSDTLIPLGCDPNAPAPAGIASQPRSNDDGSIIAFDLCDESSRCTPLYWTASAGARELAVTGGATLSGMSEDGQLVLVSPQVALGTESLLFSPDGTSVSTGMGPTPALLSADGAVVGISPAAGGAVNLLRLPRGGQLEPLGELPSAGSSGFIFTGVTPDASVITGYGGATTGYQPFRYTASDGLVFGIDGLPETADNATISALSRNGQSFAGVSLLGNTRVGVFRWTEADGVVEIGPSLTYSTPGVDPYSMAWSDDGSALVFTGDTGGPEEFAARRWTAAGAETITPGIQSTASLISGDGRVIIGNTFDVEDYRSFVWTEAAGARSIRAELESAGVDLTGWTFNTPWSLSRDGKVALGMGTCGGITTVYRMVLPE